MTTKINSYVVVMNKLNGTEETIQIEVTERSADIAVQEYRTAKIGIGKIKLEEE